jgi:hypothetical protein
MTCTLDYLFHLFGLKHHALYLHLKFAVVCSICSAGNWFSIILVMWSYAHPSPVTLSDITSFNAIWMSIQLYFQTRDLAQYSNSGVKHLIQSQCCRRGYACGGPIFLNSTFGTMKTWFCLPKRKVLGDYLWPSLTGIGLLGFVLQLKTANEDPTTIWLWRQGRAE